MEDRTTLSPLEVDSPGCGRCVLAEKRRASGTAAVCAVPVLMGTGRLRHLLGTFPQHYIHFQNCPTT